MAALKNDEMGLRIGFFSVFLALLTMFKWEMSESDGIVLESLDSVSFLLGLDRDLVGRARFVEPLLRAAWGLPVDPIPISVFGTTRRVLALSLSSSSEHKTTSLFCLLAGGAMLPSR